jgi:hypothetical protein
LGWTVVMGFYSIFFWWLPYLMNTQNLKMEQKTQFVSDLGQ